MRTSTPLAESRAQQHITLLLLSQEAWRYFIDGPDQISGPYGYKETGYLSALIDTFTQLPNFVGRRLTLGDLHQLHTLCLNDVKGTNYSRQTRHKPGACRLRGVNMNFGLNRNNTSANGMFELLQHLRDSPDCKQRIEINFRPIYADSLKEKSDEELRDLATDCVDPKKIVVFHTEYAQSDTDTEEKLAQLLDKYYESIAIATSNRETLTAIAAFCRSAAQLHAYIDGNGRMFCMTVPYLLCLQNGLPVPMMRQANVFGNFSIDEIVEEIEQGQAKTRQLLSTKMSPPDADSNLCTYTYKAIKKHAAHTKEKATRIISDTNSLFSQVLIALIDNNAEQFSMLWNRSYTNKSFQPHHRRRLVQFAFKYHAYRCLTIIDEDQSTIDEQELLYCIEHNLVEQLDQVLLRLEPVTEHSTLLPQAQYNAIIHGHLDCLKAIRETSTPPHIDAKADNGETALMTATKNNQPAVISYLLEQGANLFIDHDGFTVFAHAAHQKNLALMQTMVDIQLQSPHLSLGRLTPQSRQSYIVLIRQMLTTQKIFHSIENNLVKSLKESLNALPSSTDHSELLAYARQKAVIYGHADCQKIIETKLVPPHDTTAPETAEAKSGASEPTAQIENLFTHIDLQSEPEYIAAFLSVIKKEVTIRPTELATYRETLYAKLFNAPQKILHNIFTNKDFIFFMMLVGGPLLAEPYTNEVKRLIVTGQYESRHAAYPLLNGMIASNANSHILRYVKVILKSKLPNPLPLIMTKELSDHLTHNPDVLAQYLREVLYSELNPTEKVQLIKQFSTVMLPLKYQKALEKICMEVMQQLSSDNPMSMFSHDHRTVGSYFLYQPTADSEQKTTGHSP
ncbi:MAG: ankyrin repeat domain-containing protein [Coxiellaceae bacterium]|nr:ankyrin repeat domain-containing protein [Coxiellaceae bacterium]